jgi:hypothetical protein
MSKDENAPLHVGFDTFSANPGEKENATCHTCGDAMEVERNVNAATGWAEAMAKRSHLHDRFTCPNAGEKWHQQIIVLMKALGKSPSAALDAIYEKEIDVIKLTRKPTKEHFSTF